MKGNTRQLPYMVPSSLYIRHIIGIGSMLTDRHSFIRQRHSHSRLLVTRKLFETLMSEFHVLPRFKEFVLLFGAKYGENELEPPQLRFRRLQPRATGPEIDQYSPGFGTMPYCTLLATADEVQTLPMASGTWKRTAETRGGHGQSGKLQFTTSTE